MTSEKNAKAYQLHSFRQFKKGLKLFALIKPQPNEWILDVGCGTGALTFEFAEAVLPKGGVVAIDPDADRLALAKKAMPKELNNIDWYNLAAIDYRPPKSQQFDVIYANFVLHWMSNQYSILKNLFDYLRPGGRLGMQVVIDLPEFVEEMTLLMGPQGRVLVDSLYYTKPQEWTKMLNSAGFDIEQMEQGDDYHFANVDDFLLWWEATTNGVFAADHIPPDNLIPYRKKYYDGIQIYGKETLLVLARKPL